MVLLEACAEGEVALAGEAGFAQIEVGGVEVVGFKLLAEEAWVEGLPRPAFVKDRGEMARGPLRIISGCGATVNRMVHDGVIV